MVAGGSSERGGSDTDDESGEAGISPSVLKRWAYSLNKLAKGKVTLDETVSLFSPDNNGDMLNTHTAGHGSI